MADTNNIEVVKMLPISSDPVKAEIELNQMIYEIQHNHDTAVHEDLCGGIDPYKFLFAYNEIVGSPGDATASYGVAVIEGAADTVLSCQSRQASALGLCCCLSGFACSVP